MTLYQGRDVQASLWWLLIVSENPLWTKLPKDLVKLVLEWFVFPISRCFGGCNRWIKYEEYHFGWPPYCSDYCVKFSGSKAWIKILDTKGYPIDGYRACEICKIAIIAGGALVLGVPYCVNCWKKEEANGLFVEKKKKK